LHQISPLGLSIDVLTGGPIPDDPVKLLSSNKMRKLMKIFEINYDLVLLDTSPILGTVDVLETASFCDGVVMVERIDQITQSELNQAIAMLNQLKVIGIVANGSTHSKNSSITYSERNGNYLVRSEKSAIDFRDYTQN
jgi:Mrp family chromosome partitioning ATPase